MLQHSACSGASHQTCMHRNNTKVENNLFFPIRKYYAIQTSSARGHEIN